MDPDVVRRARPWLDILQDRYWRIEVRGIGRVPQKGPCLLVANRSGILPYDGLMVCHALHRFWGDVVGARFLVADWLMTLPFVQPGLTRLGAVRACRENALRLLEEGGHVVAFPEGAKGATKVFRQRYQLQRFGRGGVVRVALEAGAPIVPVAIVGAEELHPVLFKVETLARSVGLPFVPITPTFPLFGAAGLMPLPSKWVIQFGDPIDLSRYGPDAQDNELLISRLTEDLRVQIQSMVEEGLRIRPSVWG